MLNPFICNPTFQPTNFLLGIKELLFEFFLRLFGVGTAEEHCVVCTPFNVLPCDFFLVVVENVLFAAFHCSVGLIVGKIEPFNSTSGFWSNSSLNLHNVETVLSLTRHRRSFLIEKFLPEEFVVLVVVWFDMVAHVGLV